MDTVIAVVAAVTLVWLAALTITCAVLFSSDRTGPPGPAGPPGPLETMSVSSLSLEEYEGVLDWDHENSAFGPHEPAPSPVPPVVRSRFRGVRRSDGTVVLTIGQATGFVRGLNLSMYNRVETRLHPRLCPRKIVRFPVVVTYSLVETTDFSPYVGLMTIHGNGDVDVAMGRVENGMVRDGAMSTQEFRYGGLMDVAVSFNVENP